MSGYERVVLNEAIKYIREEEIIKILSDFSCPLNKDVEYFLKHKAIEFARQGLASTHLVFAQYKGSRVLAGYFALANKQITISQKNMNSFNSKFKRRLKRFAIYDMYLSQYIIPAPLIAQLAKNHNYSAYKLISGDELLKMALDITSRVQLDIGGKVVYLECEDNLKLLEFYESNGFVQCGKRKVDEDEIDCINGRCLIQLMIYI